MAGFKLPKLYYQILKSHVIPWMHVDGTSKFEEHQTFDIVQEQDQFLTADIRKVSSGNTLAQLNMFV